MPATPPTADQIKEADDAYQAAVVAQQAAAGEYVSTIDPFVEKRKALRVANAKVAETHASLAKLVSAATDPQLPAIPTDEE